MPNTTPPIVQSSELVEYRNAILAQVPPNSDFEPLMTFKVVAATTPEMVAAHKKAGATAGKLYPEGVTTNSEDGVRDLKELYPTYEAMQKHDLVLCLHGEKPGAFCMDRESAFLETLGTLARDFPSLRIVLEHATTVDAIEMVRGLPANVAASITLHHLRLTLDDVVGDKLSPHHFCKPIAKRPSDRDALVEAVLSGNSKFFLGSDSAPHTVQSKECDCGAAGVYTAPVLLPALAEFFDEHGRLDLLEAFTSSHSNAFYKLSPTTSKITLTESDWEVPREIDGVVPFRAGQRLGWKVAPKVESSGTNTQLQAAK